MQWGHLLEEKAEEKKPVGQRRVWREIDPGKPAEHVGLQFAQTAERVLSELEEERERLRSNKRVATS
jgi:hypothetical protein